MAGRPLNARIFIRFLVAEKARPRLRREKSTAPASIAPKVARFLFGWPGIAGNRRKSSGILETIVRRLFAAEASDRLLLSAREKGSRFPLSIAARRLSIMQRDLSSATLAPAYRPSFPSSSPLSLSLALAPASRWRPILMTNATYKRDFARKLARSGLISGQTTARVESSRVESSRVESRWDAV
jgi:hypothetical protein